MTLTLTVLRCPDRVAPETRRIEGGELIIGRGPGAAWTLSDTSDKPQISRRHCTVFYAGGGWKITDQSTNGTFLNREADPVGPAERALRDGDRLRVGPYEIELTITDDRDQRSAEIGGGVAFDPFAQSPPFAQSTPFGSSTPFGQNAPPSQFGQSAFGPDPFASGNASPFGGDSAFGSSPGEQPFGAPQSVRLPDDFANELFGSSEPPKPPPAQMDHTPAFMDVINLPQTRSVLPTNWDDLGAPATLPAAPFAQGSAPAAPSAPPRSAQAIPANWDDLDPIIPAAPAAPSAAPKPFSSAIPTDWDEPAASAPPPSSPFASPFSPSPAAPIPPVIAPAAAPEPPLAAAPTPSFFPEAEAPIPLADRTGISLGTPPAGEAPSAPVSRDPPVASVAREAAPADAALLVAFLRGAGMAGADLPDPAAAMERAGAAFRAFVIGLREVLIARAEVKSAFRIDQTMVRARGNNPLKFAAGDDDALAALLGAGRRTEMSPSAAVGEALRDIRLHELATMAAMQEAVRELLAKIEPAKLRASSESGGIGLPMQRKAKAWELYETEFAKLSESLSERFDDAFGRSFARAYEQVMAELQSKGSPR